MKLFSNKLYSKTFIATVPLMLQAAFGFTQENAKPNILFIAIDDLKPSIGSFDDKLAITPNIDALSEEGTVFKQSYCQQAVSGPSRASIMTGLRPDNTKVWDLKTKMRDINPDLVTIPQYFAQHGYSTSGIGKIYDMRCVDGKKDSASWTQPFSEIKAQYYAAETGRPSLYYYQDSTTKARAQVLLAEAKANGLKGHGAVDYAWKELRFSTENVDVPDNAYNDGACALQAIDMMADLSKEEQPFFLAVGFQRPHLPFAVPTKYWNLYNADSLQLTQTTEFAKNSPNYAYQGSWELREYADIPPESESFALPIELQKKLTHGYYASVSYSDAQVGKIIAALDSLGLRKNTIIVLWGDHGYHLGDHGMWCKHTNFEQATHAPLVISTPEKTNKIQHTFTEFIDIFPTLCELSNLQTPENLDGTSLAPLMNTDMQLAMEYAISQYPRGEDLMGYSIRMLDYRYTIWVKNEFMKDCTFNADNIIGAELYDYAKDALETENKVELSEYKDVVNVLHKQLVKTLQE